MLAPAFLFGGHHAVPCVQSLAAHLEGLAHAAEDVDSTLACELWREGNHARRLLRLRRDWALAFVRTARRLGPTTARAFNAGYCMQMLGQNAEARKRTSS